MARTKVPTDEKFEKQDFNLFEAITAIDKKDYGCYDRPTPEQQRKFCSASPGIGKQFHAWIPQIKQGVAKLKDKATPKDIKEYFKKIYPGLSAGDLTELASAFCDQHKRKMYLANKYPELKFDEVELLSELITDNDIQEYENELGN